MRRREFLQKTLAGLGATCLGGAAFVSDASAKGVCALTTPLTQKFAASDTVTLGRTGIRTSRLAMGTGTVGYAHHSNQSALGVQGLSKLLLNGYDQGLRFFDAADSYGSHPGVSEALKHVARDKVTVLTKRTRNGLHRRSAYALRHRRRLDRPLSRRNGRFRRSKAKGHYSRARMFVPHDRGASRGC